MLNSVGVRSTGSPAAQHPVAVDVHLEVRAAAARPGLDPVGDARSSTAPTRAASCAKLNGLVT